MSVRLITITPDAEKNILYMARVSNPANQDSTDGRLMEYLITHKHWSPFEMMNAVFEVECGRDVGRQILRHSGRVQEFSQRYQDVSALPPSDLREARMAHPNNRQLSVPCANSALIAWWEDAQLRVCSLVNELYAEALSYGIAKEVARSILPEGLTTTRMYINFNLRDALFFIQTRLKPDTQLETRMVARGMLVELEKVVPNVTRSFFAEAR